MALYIKRSGEDGRRGWKEGRRSAEGRSGKGPDVFPVGEERRGEDGKEEGGIESRGALSSCHAMPVVYIMVIL